MNSKTSRNLPPPPPSETLIPKFASKVPVSAQPSISPPFRHKTHQHNPTQGFSQNGSTQRPYMEPCRRLSRTPELDETPKNYTSIEYDYDTPPLSVPRHHPPELPPRTYLNQTEVEYSDPILSPDYNEYDEPGDLLRNSHAASTNEEQPNHAHCFRPPPIPPKTASMLFESQRKDEDSLESSPEVNSGILHNSIRPKEVQSICKPFSQIQNDRLSEVYLDMDPKETSSEIEKDIELEVQHKLKHQKGSSYEDCSPAYVNVWFNTIATMKGIKQIEEPFEAGFKNTPIRALPPKPLSLVYGSNGKEYNQRSKDLHYNKFTPINPHQVAPPTLPTAPLQTNVDSIKSRRVAFGERMISRPSLNLNELLIKPLPPLANSTDTSGHTIRRSSSADLLETPSRKADKPPLLPKPKVTQGKVSTNHRRSSSSHDCYNVDQAGRSDIPLKESLNRKRSDPSYADLTQPKPILRGYLNSPDQFNGRDRETRKVNFSESTQVRELTRQVNEKIKVMEQRATRNRPPITHNRPTHPPPPPPARRHSVNISANNQQHIPEPTNNQTEFRITQDNRSANIITQKGMTYPSNYMQPSLNGQNIQRPRHVQTLNRGSFFTNDDGRKDRRFLAISSSDKFIQGLKDPQVKREPWRQEYNNTVTVTSERNSKPNFKPQRWVNMV